MANYITWLTVTLSYLTTVHQKGGTKVEGIWEKGVEENISVYEGRGNREWRKLHNEELNDLYSSRSIFRVVKSRRMRWAEHVASVRERRGVYRVLVGKPDKKSPLKRPRHRWEDNIKMDLQEVGYEGMNWLELAEDRDRWWALVDAVMNLRVP